MEASETTVGQRIRQAPVGKWVTLEKRLDHGGSLQFRRLKNGSVGLAWRYGEAGARHSLGLWDPKAAPKSLEPTAYGYSIKAASMRCMELGKEWRSSGEVPVSVRKLRAEAKAVREAEVREQTALATRREGATAGALVRAYLALLLARKQPAAADARSTLTRHFLDEWPDLVTLPASSFTTDHGADVVRRIIEKGKERTSEKARAYLRAAFQTAVDARTDTTLPVAFKAFGVTVNPMADVKRNAEFYKADKNPLSLDELRRYWRLIEHEPGLSGAALRLHLLSGGQRIEQLLRLRWTDVKDGMLLLQDIKGKNGSRQPREHAVPILPALRASMDATPRLGAHVTTTDGRVSASSETMTGWAHRVVDGSIPGFKLKRVRSAVETILAAAKVSQETRGRLQSHGVSGVQARHYDGYDYLDEKRGALEVLFGLLTPESSNVVKIATRRAGS